MLYNHLFLCLPLLLLPSVFPNIRSLPMNQLFASGSQSTGDSASVSILPMNIQGWFPLRLTGLMSLLSKGFPRIFSKTTIWKHQFFGAQPSLWSNSYIHTWLLEKTIVLTIRTFVGKVMFLLFNTLFRFVIAFLLRSKHLLISWLQSLSMILDLKKIKSVTASTFLPSICHEVVMPGLPGWLSGKEFTCDAEDAGDSTGSIPGLGRFPGGGHDNPLQYFRLGESHGQKSLAGENL